jgi:hypothetical protein
MLLTQLTTIKNRLGITERTDDPLLSGLLSINHQQSSINLGASFAFERDLLLPFLHLRLPHLHLLKQRILPGPQFAVGFHQGPRLRAENLHRQIIFAVAKREQQAHLRDLMFDAVINRGSAIPKILRRLLFADPNTFSFQKESIFSPLYENFHERELLSGNRPLARSGYSHRTLTGDRPSGAFLRAPGANPFRKSSIEHRNS